MKGLVYSLEERTPNILQIWPHVNHEGWRVAAGGGRLDLPQYSYLSPARLGLGLSLATRAITVTITTNNWFIWSLHTTIYGLQQVNYQDWKIYNYLHRQSVKTTKTQLSKLVKTKQVHPFPMDRVAPIPGNITSVPWFLSLWSKLSRWVILIWVLVHQLW